MSRLIPGFLRSFKLEPLVNQLARALITIESLRQTQTNPGDARLDSMLNLRDDVTNRYGEKLRAYTQPYHDLGLKDWVGPADIEFRRWKVSQYLWSMP